MRKMRAAFVCTVAALLLVPNLALANSGDFSGGVAIGTGYAGVNTAPTNGMIVQGNVGIGTNNPNVPLEISSNVNALDTPANGTMLQLGNADGSFTSIDLDQFGSSTPGAGIVGRTYGGTNASRSALASAGLNMISVVASGYNGSALSGNVVAMNMQTAGAWTTSSEPTQIIFSTTAVGSTARTINMIVSSSGAVGIGTTAPLGGVTLDVNGTVRVGSFAAASSTAVCQNSNILSTCSSSRRYKENIKPSGLGLKEVLAMNAVTFDLKDHKDTWEKHDFGFIAEDMEKINPLFVTYNDSGETDGVRYMQLTAVNVRAIQELHAEQTKLQNEVAFLKNEIEELKSRLSIQK